MIIDIRDIEDELAGLHRAHRAVEEALTEAARYETRLRARVEDLTESLRLVTNERDQLRPEHRAG